MKTVENRFQVSFRYPLTCIIYLYYQRFIFYPDRNIDRAFLFRVLECIRHQVTYDLLQAGYIRIPINRFINITKSKIDPVLLRDRHKQFTLLPDQTAYGHPLDLYMAESNFLDLSDIQNFLDQFIQACNVFTQDTGIFLQFSISQPVSGCLDMIVHTINQSQRRTKLMRDIGEKIQLRFIQFFFLLFSDFTGDFGLFFHNPAAQPIHDTRTYNCQQQTIDNHSPRTAIPGR